MNKIVFAATMLLPSIALAHPGHTHGAMGPNHHILEAAAVAAVAVSAYFVTRLLNTKFSRNKL